MRHQNRELLAKLIEKHGPFKKVLEVGSRQVDGGGIRDLVKDSDYIGLDMIDGENVDIVKNAHDMTYENKFDLVICFDTIEHDDGFWLTVENCRKAVKKGGFFILAAPSVRCPQHDWPGDYWRFMPQSFEKIFFREYEDVYIEEQEDNPGSGNDEIAGWGKKP